jgi:hypothetical protein
LLSLLNETYSIAGWNTALDVELVPR